MIKYKPAAPLVHLNDRAGSALMGVYAGVLLVRLKDDELDDWLFDFGTFEPMMRD